MSGRAIELATSLHEIRLADIDVTDRSLSVTAGRDTKTLEHSINLCGMLNPPLLAPRRQGTGCRVVCGVLRLRAFAALGFASCTARIAAGNAAEPELLLAALCDNAAHRRYNDVEKARAAALLAAHYPEDDAVRLCAELTGTPPKRTVFAQYRKLAHADERLHELLLNDRITFETAVALCGMEQEDRDCFARLFDVLHFSASKQLELIEMCRDIGRRDGVAVRHALLHQEVRRVVKSLPDGNTAQAAEQVRRCLRRQRFPRLVQRERMVGDMLKRLSLPAGIAIEPPPYFEGNRWRVIATATCAEEIWRASAVLARLAETPEFRALFQE